MQQKKPAMVAVAGGKTGIDELFPAAELKEEPRRACTSQGEHGNELRRFGGGDHLIGTKKLRAPTNIIRV